jgi:hypothetical protein
MIIKSNPSSSENHLKFHYSDTLKCDRHYYRHFSMYIHREEWIDGAIRCGRMGIRKEGKRFILYMLWGY